MPLRPSSARRRPGTTGIITAFALAKEPDITDQVSATRDGAILAVARPRAEKAWPWTASWQKPDAPQPLVASGFLELNGRISPNGRWLAYQSSESGRWEIYVRPFPAVEQGRWQASVDGGHNPEWRADGRELFFGDERHGRFMSASVETDGATFSAGRPVALFPVKWLFEYGWAVDVSRDGQRFLMTPLSQPHHRYTS